MIKKSIANEVADVMSTLLNKKATGPFELPENHVPAVIVPNGGSCCANCKYVEERDSESHCKNEYFIKWQGTSKLPAPAAEFCSDWWETK